MRLINLLFIILLATASYVTIAQPVQTQYDQTEINFSINPELAIYKIHPALYPGDLPSCTIPVSVSEISVAMVADVRPACSINLYRGIGTRTLAIYCLNLPGCPV